MYTGSLISGLLHVALIIVAVLGLPRWSKPVSLDQQAVPIPFATVAEKRSAPAETPEPLPKPPPEPAKTEPPEPPPTPQEVAKAEPQPPPPPKPEPAKLPEPPPPPPEPAKLPEPAPPPPEPPKVAMPAPPPAPTPKAKPKPPPKPKPKAAEKKPEPPKPKLTEKKPEPPKPDDFLSRMQKAVSKHKPPPVTPPPQPQLARVGTQRTRLQELGSRLTMSEEDAVRQHISRCWIEPAGAREVHDMEVRLEGKVNRHGVVQKVDVDERDKARMREDPFFRTLAESAMRAVLKCPQLPLPPHKYESWKDFKFRFKPRDMLDQ